MMPGPSRRQRVPWPHLPWPRLPWPRLANEAARNAMILLGVVWIVTVAFMLRGGPTRDAATAALAQEEEAESALLCARLGAPADSAAYPACASTLNRARREAERRQAEWASPLP